MIHASHSKSHSLQMRVEITAHSLSTCAVVVGLEKEFPENWRCNRVLQERGSATRICNPTQRPGKFCSDLIPHHPGKFSSSFPVSLTAPTPAQQNVSFLH